MYHTRTALVLFTQCTNRKTGVAQASTNIFGQTIDVSAGDIEGLVSDGYLREIGRPGRSGFDYIHTPKGRKFCDDYLRDNLAAEFDRLTNAADYADTVAELVSTANTLFSFYRDVFSVHPEHGLVRRQPTVEPIQDGEAPTNDAVLWDADHYAVYDGDTLVLRARTRSGLDQIILATARENLALDVDDVANMLGSESASKAEDVDRQTTRIFGMETELSRQNALGHYTSDQIRGRIEAIRTKLPAASACCVAGVEYGRTHIATHAATLRLERRIAGLHQLGWGRDSIVAELGCPKNAVLDGLKDREDVAQAIIGCLQSDSPTPETVSDVFDAMLADGIGSIDLDTHGLGPAESM